MPRIPWFVPVIVGGVFAALVARAERMREAHLDGFEIQCYGHLMDGFWSPATGWRADDYGGSLDNRLRFGMRVLKAIRDRVGQSLLVGLRISADEDWEQGLSRAEGVDICKRFRDSGLIDFLNIRNKNILIKSGDRVSADHVFHCALLHLGLFNLGHLRSFRGFRHCQFNLRRFRREHFLFHVELLYRVFYRYTHITHHASQD